MQKHLFYWIGLVFFSSASLFGQASQGEFRAYYQNISGFDYRSGSDFFDVTEEGFHGGGFGFVFNLNDWLGFFSETNFFSGVEQQGLDLKLLNQVQGVKLTARELGPLNLYAKGGLGFARFVFDTGGGEAVRYQTSLSSGGGVDFLVSDPMAFFIEGNLMTFSLPDITGAPDRDKWDASFGTTVGVVLFF